MFTDFVLNGEGHGAVGEQLAACHFDPNMLRPYVNQRGEKCVTVNTGSKYDPKTGQDNPTYGEFTLNEMHAKGIDNPVWNATALRKDDWLRMDRVVIRAARQRMRAWADLSAANSMGGFNGMGTMVLEHETLNAPGIAVVDMEGTTEGRSDLPLFQREALPLPITHSDFHYSRRKLEVSRTGGTPLSMVMPEEAALRVAETIEKTTIGVTAGISYGDASGIYGVDSGAAPKVYGYTNFPNRNVKTDMTLPDGTNGTTVLTSWLALRDLLYTDRFYGPYMAYTSSDYDKWLDNLFSTTEPSAGTLRSRLLQIDDIQGIRRLDFLSDTATVILVQMTSNVAEAVNGMELTTVQWESKGGMQLNFKVMAIQVPRLRSDYYGRCGIAHGTTS